MMPLKTGSLDVISVIPKSYSGAATFINNELTLLSS